MRLRPHWLADHFIDNFRFRLLCFLMTSFCHHNRQLDNRLSQLPCRIMAYETSVGDYGHVPSVMKPFPLCPI